MRIPPGKIAALIGAVFIYGTGIIAINLSDNLRVTRLELTRFYETEMDSCTIEQIDTLDAENRGGYQVFYTDCSNDFFPIFLQDNSKKEIIKINSVIVKKSNSLDVHILDKDKHHNLKIRHPDTQDDRGFGTMVALGFIGVATLLILVLPNSKFEKKQDT
jgi:hypothetical protein